MTSSPRHRPAGHERRPARPVKNGLGRPSRVTPSDVPGVSLSDPVDRSLAGAPRRSNRECRTATALATSAYGPFGARHSSRPPGASTRISHMSQCRSFAVVDRQSGRGVSAAVTARANRSARILVAARRADRMIGARVNRTGGTLNLASQMHYARSALSRRSTPIVEVVPARPICSARCSTLRRNSRRVGTSRADSPT